MSMKTRTRTVYCGLALIVVSLVVVGLERLVHRGPSFQGRGLDFWVSELCFTAGDRQTRAAFAIRQMGPEALAPLVRMVHSRDYPWSDALMELDQRFPGLELRVTPASVRRAQAVRGFWALGPAANAAVGDLSVLPASPDELMDVLNALAAIGREAIPVMVQALASDDPGIRDRTVLMLGTVRGYAASVMPELIRMLKDEDEEVRSDTVAVLRKICRGQPAASLAVAGMLADPAPTVRRIAATELRTMDYRDGSIVTRLIRLLKDSDPGVRIASAITLGKIGVGDPLVARALDESTADSDEKVRHFARLALNGMDGRGNDSQSAGISTNP